MSTDIGLFEAFRRISGTAIAILQSRLELAELEINEARQRLLKTVALGLIGLLLLIVGVVALSGCIVILLWPTLGTAALALFGLLYLGLGIGLLVWLAKAQHRHPRMLEATTAELQRDAAMLRGSAPDPSSHP